MIFARYEDQLATWFAGHPEHHGERGSKVSRCVPDFSCCRPELLSAPGVRLAYVESSREERRAMVEGFMRRAIESHIKIPGLVEVRH